MQGSHDYSLPLSDDYAAATTESFKYPDPQITQYYPGSKQKVRKPKMKKENFDELKEPSKYLEPYDSRWRNIIASEVREFPNRFKSK
jgi:hypothetical protein